MIKNLFTKYKTRLVRICFLIIVLLIPIAIFSWDKIIYHTSGGFDASVAPPTFYLFKHEMFDTDTYVDIEDAYFDRNAGEYYIDILPMYKGDVYAYVEVTGTMLNYPYKPVVTINGSEIKDVTISDEIGKGKREYTFVMKGSLKTDTKYRIFIKAGRQSLAYDLYFVEY